MPLKGCRGYIGDVGIKRPLLHFDLASCSACSIKKTVTRKKEFRGLGVFQGLVFWPEGKRGPGVGPLERSMVLVPNGA